LSAHFFFFFFLIFDFALRKKKTVEKFFFFFCLSFWLQQKMAESIILRLRFPEAYGVTKAMKFDSRSTVREAKASVVEKFKLSEEDACLCGFWLPAPGGYWLQPKRRLSDYPLSALDVVEFRERKAKAKQRRVSKADRLKAQRRMSKMVCQSHIVTIYLPEIQAARTLKVGSDMMVRDVVVLLHKKLPDIGGRQFFGLFLLVSDFVDVGDAVKLAAANQLSSDADVKLGGDVADSSSSQVVRRDSRNLLASRAIRRPQSIIVAGASPVTDGAVAESALATSSGSDSSLDGSSDGNGGASMDLLGKGHDRRRWIPLSETDKFFAVERLDKVIHKAEYFRCKVRVRSFLAPGMTVDSTMSLPCSSYTVEDLRRQLVALHGMVASDDDLKHFRLYLVFFVDAEAAEQAMSADEALNSEPNQAGLPLDDERTLLSYRLGTKTMLEFADSRRRVLVVSKQKAAAGRALLVVVNAPAHGIAATLKTDAHATPTDLISQFCRRHAHVGLASSFGLYRRDGDVFESSSTSSSSLSSSVSTRRRWRQLDDAAPLLALGISNMDTLVLKERKVDKRRGGGGGGGGTKVVGVEPSTLPRETFRGRTVPMPLVLLVNALVKADGLALDGIFRRPGLDATIKQIRQQLDAGKFAASNAKRQHDPYSLAASIKRWLGALPTRVLANIDRDLIDSGMEDADIALTIIEQIKDPLAKEIFLFVIELMADVARLAAKNRMDSKNLAIVVAPVLVAPPGDDPMSDLVRVQNSVETIRNIIEHFVEHGYASAKVACSDKVESSSSSSSSTTTTTTILSRSQSATPVQQQPQQQHTFQTAGPTANMAPRVNPPTIGRAASSVALTTPSPSTTSLAPPVASLPPISSVGNKITLGSPRILPPQSDAATPPPPPALPKSMPPNAPPSSSASLGSAGTAVKSIQFSRHPSK
jgi:RhoGAP domain/N-terminal or F0 domain of Talin-head FERM